MIYESTISYVEWGLFWYFLSINVVYSILLALGAIVVYRRHRELGVEDFTTIFQSDSLPEITFIVPIFNEEKNVINCLKSILNLSYRYKQIIVVNDGSSDNTMDILKKEYDLVSIPKFFNDTLKTQPITGIFRSRSCPQLFVLDKEHKGKFDAVNAGVNATKNPYFIAVDADVFIDNSGFDAMVRPLLAYPEAVAIGGTVRIKNGCTLDYNRINTKKLSFKPIFIFQGLEYLRAFLQRQGWNYLGGNFVIAGAFSIFPAELTRESGGFSASVAEDMEIVVRLYHIMKKRKKPYRIFYLPDPVAWTEGPSTLAKLGRQRTRWHLGQLETLWIHKHMLLNPRYGLYGIFNYFFWVWGEALEPVIEAAGYGLICFGLIIGFINIPFALLLLMITLGFTFVYSLLCLLIEELSFCKYISMKTVIVMFLLSLVENCGYRQLTVYWRLRSFAYFFKNYRALQKESKRLKRLMR